MDSVRKMEADVGGRMIRWLEKMWDDKICSNCGGLMRQTGTCFTCTQCGESDGCG